MPRGASVLTNCSLCKRSYGVECAGITVCKHMFALLPNADRNVLRHRFPNIAFGPNAGICCLHFKSHTKLVKREGEVESVCKKFKKNFYPGLVDDLEVFADAPAGEMRHRRRSASQADLTLPPSKVGAFNPESPSFDQEAKDFVEKQADEIKRLKAENEKQQEELLRLKKNFRSPGVHIIICDDAARARWFDLSKPDLARKLYSEMVPRLSIHPNDAMVRTARLDTLLFVLKHGMPLARVALGSVANADQESIGIAEQTLRDNLRRTLKQLMPWAKEQIEFLSPAEWLSDSKKALLNPKFKIVLPPPPPTPPPSFPHCSSKLF